ncbi:hypothetical protein [Sphingomonas soli]|uniref:hypothetical protein n=1 Tax=Sphingomonas soli TaxID=266127 RepID=UPI0012EE79FF|nr:hypothetical protein [Sphingomonas soli]
MKFLIIISAIFNAFYLNQNIPDKDENWTLGCIDISGAARVPRESISHISLESIQRDYKLKPFRRTNNLELRESYNTGNNNNVMLIYDIDLVSDISIVYIININGNIVRRFVSVQGFPDKSNLKIDENCDSWRN